MMGVSLVAVLWLAFKIFSCCLSLALALLLLLRIRDAVGKHIAPGLQQRVAVLVLGDVGRSPRMQYHALSLARDIKESTGVHIEVDLIGYEGEPCIDDLRRHPQVTIHTVPTVTRPTAIKIPFILWAPVKVLLQVFLLLRMLLLSVSRMDALLVQTPPAIPTLAVAGLVSLLRGCRLVVDWHNFGYTILAINMKSSNQEHWLVRLALKYERFFARVGCSNLCVTRAMQEWLRREWGVKAHVLHDQPPAFFRRTSLEEMHELFSRLGQTCSPGREDRAGLSEALWAAGCAQDAGSTGQTLLTTRDASSGEVRLREDRPMLLVSSTSWTEDEDFGVLLDALLELDERIKEDARCPRVLCVVTGKGPQRAHYETRITGMQLVKVRVKTMWLEAADYPRLLGCCDLGVSLHYSSSGLDLPMKVLDMFGAGMPVCAMGFRCLSELVQDEVNGLVFKDSKQLADQLQLLINCFPNSMRLSELRANVKPGQWTENWLQNAMPVILPDLNNKSGHTD